MTLMSAITTPTFAVLRTAVAHTATESLEALSFTPIGASDLDVPEGRVR